MRQYMKAVLSAIFAVLIVSSMATVCMGYPMYELGVKEGDWVEYDVLEAENYEFFTDIHSGDKLRFEVVGIEVQERMYPNGTVLFEVEAPVCEVFLNGEHIKSNVTLSEMIFYPKGEEHWRSLDKIEDVWKIEAPKYGMSHESYMTFGQDKVNFTYRMEGAASGSTKQIVHKDTGIALEFERYTYARENRTGYYLKICDTNVPGVLVPWYTTYWYLIILLAAVAFLAFAVLLKGWQSKKKGGQKDEKMIRGADAFQNGHEERKLSGLENKSWWKIILYCMSFLLIFFISAIVVSLLTGWIQNPSVRFAIREIFLRLPLTFVLFWLFAHYVIKKPLSFFLIRKPANEILKWISIGFVLPLSVILIYLIFGKIELIEHADPLSSSKIVYLVVATISMALLGGIIEEILFRGYMFRILEEKWNSAIAILGPAMLFGSIHLLMIDSIDLVNVILVVIPITLVGVMLGLIVYATRNIWNAVVVHGIWNLFLAGRIIRISAFENHQFNAIYQLQITSDHILLTGGSFGVESAVPAIAVYLTAILVLLLHTRSRYSRDT